MPDVLVTCPHCGKQHPVDPAALKRAAARAKQAALFEPSDEPEHTHAAAPIRKSMAGDRAMVLEFDGGSRGNPGPAGIGVRLLTEDGVALYELSEFIGQATSNVAEYTALLRGLKAALAWKASKLTIRADSELVVRQLNGQYKVKSPDLRPLFEQATALMDKLGTVKVFHVYREANKRCDMLANLAMDKKTRTEPEGPLPDAV
jgi:ribonuclease HI